VINWRKGKGGVSMVLNPQPNERYTYKDYLEWPDEERWELINGIPYNMTPAPSPKHQEILGELYRQISNHLFGKTCRPYIAPFDVRLFPNEKQNDHSVVQPDLTVVCDLSKITSVGCEGVPDFIIEILSPSTAKKDRSEKKRLYERAGVMEYWIVDPFNHTIEVFILSDEGKYGEAALYGKEDEIRARTFKDLVITLDTLFV
jgi:Uma2 family endonuclease